MWKPTIEFVIGLSLGFIYAYLNAFLVSNVYSRPSRSVRCYCPQMVYSNHVSVPADARDLSSGTEVKDVHSQPSQAPRFGKHNNTTSPDSSIRLLCWIMTNPQNLENRAKNVKNTWAQRCDKYLFISSETNADFPTVGVDTSEGREHLTEKTMLGYEYVYNNHFHDADWFLKADDDAYVIVENLRYFLSSQNTEEPVYFGHHFKTIIEQGYFSGGSGFVLSKEAMRRFGQQGTESNLCRNQKGVGGDANFGKCMQNLGVRVGNSTDKYGRNRFHCFDPETHLRGNYPPWYYTYDANGARAGPESMSTYPISYHYMESNMLMIHQLLYHTRLHGVEAGDLENINQDQT